MKPVKIAEKGSRMNLNNYKSENQELLLYESELNE